MVVDPKHLSAAILAVDELLTAAGAQVRMTGLANELASRRPDALSDLGRADQRDVALAQAGRDTAPDYPPIDLWLGDHPDWARLGLLYTFGEWVCDQARVCEHRPNCPGPAHTAARQPGLVVCPQCQHLLGEPQRCDGCGTETTGVLYLVAVSAFSYQVYVCDDCQYAQPQT